MFDKHCISRKILVCYNQHKLYYKSSKSNRLARVKVCRRQLHSRLKQPKGFFAFKVLRDANGGLLSQHDCAEHLILKDMAMTGFGNKNYSVNLQQKNCQIS